jgi:hypothetical protein
VQEEQHEAVQSHCCPRVLGLVALLQLLRVILGWSVVVDGLAIPLWASAVACLVAAVLAAMVWREARQ